MTDRQGRGEAVRRRIEPVWHLCSRGLQEWALCGPWPQRVGDTKYKESSLGVCRWYDRNTQHCSPRDEKENRSTFLNLCLQPFYAAQDSSSEPLAITTSHSEAWS